MQEKYYTPFLEIEKIETPALLLDMDTMEENVRLMASHFNKVKANLRPHFKAHKCTFLALKQIEAGAIGMTCAKVGEAEALVKAGVREILIANQIITRSKIERMALLARNACIIVAVDSLQNLKDISDIASAFGVEIGVLVEIDVGLGRCGVRNLDDGVRLAKEATDLPGIEFRGVMGYEGHCNKYVELKKRTEEVIKANALLVQLKKAITDAGIPVEIVSAGGTTMFNLTTMNEEITEVQAGAYILMGTKWSMMEGAPFKQAETILATIVSIPADDILVIDAGHKSFTTESGPPAIKGHTGIEIAKISEEHCNLKLLDNTHHFKLGDIIELIPSNCCTTTNLYDYFYATRGGRMEMVLNIDGRGRSD